MEAASEDRTSVDRGAGSRCGNGDRGSMGLSQHRNSLAARDQFQLQGLFGQWVDRTLAPRWPRCASVHIGFRNGLRLVALAEALTGLTPVGVVEDPRLVDDMANNVFTALALVERSIKARIVDAHPDEVVDGNTTEVLSILTFLISEFDPEGSIAALATRSRFHTIKKEPWHDGNETVRSKSARKLFSRPSEVSLAPASMRGAPVSPATQSPVSTPNSSPPHSPGSSPVLAPRKTSRHTAASDWSLCRGPANAAVTTLTNTSATTSATAMTTSTTGSTSTGDEIEEIHLPPRPQAPPPKPPVDHQVQLCIEGARANLQKSSPGALLRQSNGMGLGPIAAGQRGLLPRRGQAPVLRRRNESGKGMTEMPEGLIDALTKAIAANLSCNKLKAFPRQLCTAEVLEELDLSANAIPSLPDIDVLGQMRSLVTLKLSLNPLPHDFPGAVFCLPNLRELSLSRCGIRNIVPCDDALAPLRTLDLEYNDLERLPEQFGGFRGLRTLSLSFNHLTTLPESLAKISTLTELRISNNKIASLPPFSSLVSLEASRNAITALPSAWFVSPSQTPPISVLQLQGNPLRRLPDAFFDRFSSLNVLDLSETSLEEIPPIKGDHLEGLYIGGNALTEVPLCQDGIPALLYIDVSRNRLSHLPAFPAGHRLRSLCAGFNPLEDLPASLPSELRDLHLSGCGLKKMPYYPLARLESLSIHSNDFETLTFGPFVTNSALRFIDVSHNRLTTIPHTLPIAKASGVEVVDSPMQSPLPPDPLAIGIASTSGRRQTMEDVIVVSDDLLRDGSVRLVGVFDGHGGISVASQASKFVVRYLEDHLAGCLSCPEFIRQKLSIALQVANRQFQIGTLDNLQGSTALMGLFTDAGLMLHIANLGDTRAVLSRSGRAIRLSTDHKPLAPDEYTRICNAGGWVTPEGRILNMLSVARALGDRALSPLVSDEAFVASYKIDLTDDFVIFACDGIWDVLSDDAAVKIVHDSLSLTKNASMAAVALRDWAYIGGSVDNLSVVVVPLRPY